MEAKHTKSTIEWLDLNNCTVEHHWNTTLAGLCRFCLSCAPSLPRRDQIEIKIISNLRSAWPIAVDICWMLQLDDDDDDGPIHR